MVLPELAAVEHVRQKLPLVPEIVRDAPHIGISSVLPGPVDMGWSRGEAEHDVPAGFLDGLMEHFGLVPAAEAVVSVHPAIADIIAFDEVHAPVRVHPNQAVIISPSRRIVPHPVHVRVPAADRGRVCGIRRRVRAARYGQVLMGRKPGDAPHDGDAELQAQAVDIIRQWAEPPALCRRGETVHRRLISAVSVHLHVPEGDVLEFAPPAPGILRVPLDVHHHVLPTAVL